MSPSEAFNIALMEATAAEVPVLAIDTPVHAEVLQRAGWPCSSLVDPNARPDALAAEIERLASDAALHSARPHVATWDQVWRKTQTLYASVLAEQQ
jgi:glycosyltransferase involved in cell wall biosynthesis